MLHSGYGGDKGRDDDKLGSQLKCIVDSIYVLLNINLKVLITQNLSYKYTFLEI
jgi:hypothetical protein